MQRVRVAPLRVDTGICCIKLIKPSFKSPKKTQDAHMANPNTRHILDQDPPRNHGNYAVLSPLLRTERALP